MPTKLLTSKAFIPIILSLLSTGTVTSLIYSYLIPVGVSIGVAYIVSLVLSLIGIILITKIYSYIVNIFELASLDYLTGVYNRDKIVKYMEHMILKNQRFYLLVYNLPNINEINDKYGPTTGDTLLENIATYLVESVRIQDVVGRVEGNTFSIVVPAGKDDTTILPIINRIAEHIPSKYQIDNNFINVKFNLGTTVFPDNAKDVSSLLTQAGCAIHNAKHNNVDIFMCHPGSIPCKV